jgi:hypothetical protein
MNFEIISEISDIEIIAVGSGIRDIARLRRVYGKGSWRKMKGVATVRLRNGRFGWQNCTGMRRMVSASVN